MHLRRRDFLLATGLTFVFGSGANARILVEGGGGPPERMPTRRLYLKHAHTGEVFSGPYRDNLGPIPEAMQDLAVFLRDHHENVVGPIFVETLDFLADVIEAAGQSQATVLSAYRTKKTNDMLATRIFGVAEKSQHLLGRAIDITLDSKLSSAMTSARRMERGGVGWYPHSHFIHLDSGPVRNWTLDASGGDRLLARLRAKPLQVRLREKRLSQKQQPTGEAPISPPQQLRPLTVQERLRLQRALAKQQFRERAH